MTYDDSNRLPVNEKLLIRVFSRITVSTKHFYEGEPCWEWTGHTNKRTGYGGVYVVHPCYAKIRNNYPAHRLTYEMFVSIVPNGYEVDHLCRVRHCVNPVHLEAVPPRENVLRGISFSAINAKKTHCKHGHPLEGDNLIFSKQRTKAGLRSGAIMRVCRACRRIKGKISAQKWRDARKAKGLTTNPYSKKSKTA